MSFLLDRSRGFTRYLIGERWIHALLNAKPEPVYYLKDGLLVSLTVTFRKIERLPSGEIHLEGVATDGKEIHVYVATTHDEQAEIWNGKRP